MPSSLAESLADLVELLGGPAMGALKVRDHCRINVSTANTHHKPACPERYCRCAACWASCSSNAVCPTAPGQVCSQSNRSQAAVLAGFCRRQKRQPHPSSGVRPMLVSMHAPSLMAHTLAPAPAGTAAALNKPRVPAAAAATLSKPPVLAVAAPGKWSHSLPAAQHLAEIGTVPGPASFLTSVDGGDWQAGLHLCEKL